MDQVTRANLNKIIAFFCIYSGSIAYLSPFENLTLMCFSNWNGEWNFHSLHFLKISAQLTNFQMRVLKLFYLKGVNFKGNMNSFIQKILIKHLMCARYYSKPPGILYWINRKFYPHGVYKQDFLLKWMWVLKEGGTKKQVSWLSDWWHYMWICRRSFIFIF